MGKKILFSTILVLFIQVVCGQTQFEFPAMCLPSLFDGSRDWVDTLDCLGVASNANNCVMRNVCRRQPNGGAMCQPRVFQAGDFCSDGTFCNGVDSCNSAGQCVATGRRPCGPLNSETTCNFCNEALHICGFDPNDGIQHSCNDGDFCNGINDVCQGTTCIGNPNPALANPCIGMPDCLSTCNETTQMCLSPFGSPCNDGDVSNGADQCDGMGACNLHGGAGVTQSDTICNITTGDAGNDACQNTFNPTTGSCLAPLGSICDDGVAENGADFCDGFGSCNIHSIGVGAGNDNSANGNDLSQGAILGIALGATMLVACFCAAVLGLAILRFYRPGGANRGSMRDDAQSLLLVDETPRRGKLVEIEDVTVGKLLGEGNFGNVYKGMWNRRGQNIPVALKSLKSEDFAAFREELGTLLQLSHPNIVLLFGLYHQSEEHYIVMEFVSEGSLKDILQRADSERLTTPANKLQWVRDACQGVQFLHSQRIVHRDLACRNILIAKEAKKYIAKVSDFGMARVIENEYTSSDSRLPIKWSAPESLKFSKFSSSSDVYSLGIVIWEIYSNGFDPWHNLTNAEARKAVSGGATLAKPTACPEYLYSLLQWCWQADPKKRPKVGVLLDHIDRQQPWEHSKQLASPSVELIDLKPTVSSSSFYSEETAPPPSSDSKSTKANKKSKNVMPIIQESIYNNDTPLPAPITEDYYNN